MDGRPSKSLQFCCCAALAMLLASCGSIPPSRDDQQTGVAATAARPGDAQCLAQLGATGAQFLPLPDRYYGGECSTVNTVRLEDLAGDQGEFSLSNLGPVNCRLANEFANWARFGVDRAARQVLGSSLKRIETMGSYSCRTIAGSNRISAHAKAEAIDVSAFDLADGRRISVKTDWSSGTPEERKFLQIIHRSACKRFGTVLGPDYNSAHQNHFHLEVTGNSYCR